MEGTPDTSDKNSERQVIVDQLVSYAMSDAKHTDNESFAAGRREPAEGPTTEQQWEIALDQAARHGISAGEVTGAALVKIAQDILSNNFRRTRQALTASVIAKRFGINEDEDPSVSPDA